MRYTKLKTATFFFFIGIGFLHAQETVPATGGEATGTGGSASYSVGQVVYTTNTGINGSVAQGVQHPFEISVVTGINETAINLGLNVYPNPTTNFLCLKVDASSSLSNHQLSYQLIDLQGKVIESKKVTATTSTIKMEELPKAVYFLNVTDNKQIIKSFKVIKN
jgi:hypothetical protein